jgi:intracellular sulfur oxidation DsrE/DsrF family protein
MQRRDGFQLDLVLGRVLLGLDQRENVADRVALQQLDVDAAITLPGPKLGREPLGLEDARLVNMLAAGGVPAGKRHIVTVVHGPATDAVVSDAAYAARHNGQKNPNTAMIAALQAAGVSVRICGQAMTGQKIAETELVRGVQLDLAALMTVTNLQFQGYALVAD